MFDFVKTTTYSKLTFKNLLKNPFLEFIEHINTNTGEVNYSSKYKGLTIKLFSSGRVQIAGSLHKYYNDGLHNWNDFSLSKLKDVLNSLELDLEIDLVKASINNLEFGVNVITSFSPNSLINDLLCFKWAQFDSIYTIGQGYGKQCKRSSQYFVKIYNKALQNHRQENILRIEKKIIAMVALKFGELSLSDLLNPDLWQHCKRELINMVDEILINEPFNVGLLTKKEEKIYDTVVNQRNWIDLDRYKKLRYKKRFNEIVAIYGQQQYKPIIVTLINKKFEQLMNS